MPSSSLHTVPEGFTATSPGPPPLPSPPSRVRALCQTAVTLVAWYCISSAIILTTKWLFVNHFSFPLTVTTFSNTITTVWAFLVSRRPKWRPDGLTRKQFFEYVLPIGITTALEIGCSNIALKLLTVTFGTILKGGSPIFTMLWGLLFRIESFSVNLFISLTTIALGIALASMGEGHSFSITGFVLQLLATALGGLRWAMTQVLLKGSSDSTYLPPLTATLYTSPTTAVCVLPFAIGFEAIPAWNRLNELDFEELRTIFLTMFFVATLVFILLVSEYWLVHATSSLALSVAGVFKELLTIGGGIYIFAEHISFLNTVGFVICQLGIFAYIYLRYDPQSQSNQSVYNHQYTQTPSSPSSSTLPPSNHSVLPIESDRSSTSHHSNANGSLASATNQNENVSLSSTTQPVSNDDHHASTLQAFSIDIDDEEEDNHSSIINSTNQTTSTNQGKNSVKER